MSDPIYTCFTKAIIKAGDALEHGPNWVTARRARLKVFENRLECADWVIRYDEISAATLYAVRSPVLRIPGYVLQIDSSDKRYHFGLNTNRYWRGELPFPVQRESANLRLSMFSVVVRVLAAIWILSLLVRWALRWV